MGGGGEGVCVRGREGVWGQGGGEGEVGWRVCVCGCEERGQHVRYVTMDSTLQSFNVSTVPLS